MTRSVPDTACSAGFTLEHAENLLQAVRLFSGAERRLLVETHVSLLRAEHPLAGATLFAQTPELDLVADTIARLEELGG